MNLRLLLAVVPILFVVVAFDPMDPLQLRENHIDTSPAGRITLDTPYLRLSRCVPYGHSTRINVDINSADTGILPPPLERPGCFDPKAIKELKKNKKVHNRHVDTINVNNNCISGGFNAELIGCLKFGTPTPRQPPTILQAKQYPGFTALSEYEGESLVLIVDDEIRLPDNTSIKRIIVGKKTYHVCTDYVIDTSFKSGGRRNARLIDVADPMLNCPW